jgi:hypothetical protein
MSLESQAIPTHAERSGNGVGCARGILNTIRSKKSDSP